MRGSKVVVIKGDDSKDLQDANSTRCQAFIFLLSAEVNFGGRNHWRFVTTKL
jgi:hypothetical protein